MGPNSPAFSSLGLPVGFSLAPSGVRGSEGEKPAPYLSTHSSQDSSGKAEPSQWRARLCTKPPGICQEQVLFAYFLQPQCPSCE